MSETRGDSVEPAASAQVGSVAAVEGELARLWRELRSGPLESDVPIRACMSNLMVFCSDAAELQRAEADAAEIVRRHPSRLLLLVTDAKAAERGLEALVSAYCHLGGSGSRLCSEAVTLRAGDEAQHRLASAARSLLIGDLPTTLWWTPSHQAPPEFGGLLNDLSAMADQVVYDSRGWLDPVRGVIATADWALRPEMDPTISDLAWRRLKPWRRLIAQSLDPALAPGALESVREIEVEHGPHALPKAWLLIGWLACRLGWRPQAGQVEPGVEVTWGLDAPHGRVQVTVRRRSKGDPELEKVVIRWDEGDARREQTFVRLDRTRIAVLHERSEEPRSVLSTRGDERAGLVARQLAGGARDELFNGTLEVSRTMARALLR